MDEYSFPHEVFCEGCCGVSVDPKTIWILDTLLCAHKNPRYFLGFPCPTGKATKEPRIYHNACEICHLGNICPSCSRPCGEYTAICANSCGTIHCMAKDCRQEFYVDIERAEVTLGHAPTCGEDCELTQPLARRGYV